MIDLRRYPTPRGVAVYVILPRPAWVPAGYPDDPDVLADRLDAHARDAVTPWEGWHVAATAITRHAPDLTVTVAREPVSESMLVLAEREVSGTNVEEYRVSPSGLMVCPACGRHQTRGADGRPTPHTTEMGGSQLCSGRPPTGAPS